MQRPDGRVLLARRSNVSYGNGLWGLPGGHAQVDESWRAAAARETLEEVGVTVDPEHLLALGIGRYFDIGLQGVGGVHGVDAFFLAQSWEGEPSAVSECSKVQWFDPTNLPADALPWLGRALDTHLVRREWLYEDL